MTRSVPSGFYVPHGINDFGQIVGDFTLRGPSVGFLYDAGAVHTDVVPGSFEFSYLGGINDSGQLAGTVVTQQGATEAILISQGTPQTFTYPDSTATEARGINNWGQVVGDYRDAGGLHGFVGTPGDLSAIDVPGGSQTVAYAINDWGQIAGSYQGADGHQHGFLDSDGAFASIDVPGAQATEVTGLNDWGQIVGYYDDSANQRHGFVLTGGQFQTLDAPGASITSAASINNLGEIAGYAEFRGPGGLPPEAQVWVAKPSFIHSAGDTGTANAGAGSCGTGLPATTDVAALLRAITGHEAGQPDSAAGWADPTGGPASAAGASLETAVTGITGSHAWPTLSDAQTWALALQHAGST